MNRCSSWPLLLILLWVLPVDAQNPFWRDPLRLTNGWLMAQGAEMVFSSNAIHVVCHGGSSPSLAGIFYFHSFDGGLSFSQGFNLDTVTTGASHLPSVAAAGQTVHVVWEEQLPGGIIRVSYRRSTDGGFHWERPQVLNSDGAIRPRVACQGDSVYVLYGIMWEPRHSRFRYSYDAGQQWSQEIQIFPECVYPDLTACDSQIFIAYQHYIYPINEIYLRRSLNGGQSWQDPVQVSLSPGIPSQAPHIAVESGGFMAVSWFDHENAPPGFTGYIHVRSSPDYGQDFDSVHVVSTTPYCTSNDVALSEGAIHVAYSDERWGVNHSGIYYRQSPDGGFSWFPEDPLCDDSSQAQYPSIVAVWNWVHVTWEGIDSTGYDIYFIAGEKGALGVSTLSWTLRNDLSLQVFPNPANSISVIAFELPTASEIELSVFDLRGRKIANLMQGSLDTGKHRFDFIDSNLASGIYWIRMAQGGYQYIKSLTILR